jgi:hypothetical protein
MVSNGDAGGQVLIASDNKTYIYNYLTHAFTTVGTATVSTLPYSVAFINGYFLRLDPALSQVEFSALEDGTSWDPLDIFRRNDATDRWERIIDYHKELWCFGAETTSVYYNGDDPDIPFQPIASAFIPVGIAATNSACVVDGQLMWIGQSAAGSGIVYRANGYTPERVSTHAVEYAFEQLGRSGLLSIAEGSTYQENGHVFYVLSFYFSEDFPSATWVYDATAGLWHERGAYNGLAYDALPVRGNAHLASNPSELSHYTISRTTGAVYYQSTAYHVGTDGLGIKRLRRAPHISKENKGCIIDNVELKFEPGVANATGAGSDPQWSLTFSKNGGQTWSNARTVSAGLIGQYDTRAIWTRLGYGRDRLIEITTDSPCFMPIIDAYVDVRTGAA